MIGWPSRAGVIISPDGDMACAIARMPPCQLLAHGLKRQLRRPVHRIIIAWVAARGVPHAGRGRRAVCGGGGGPCFGRCSDTVADSVSAGRWSGGAGCCRPEVLTGVSNICFCALDAAVNLFHASDENVSPLPDDALHGLRYACRCRVPASCMA